MNSAKEIFFLLFSLLSTESCYIVVSDIPMFYAPSAISFKFEEHFVWK